MGRMRTYFSIAYSLLCLSSALYGEVFPGARFPNEDEASAVSFEPGSFAISRGTGVFRSLNEGSEVDSIVYRVDESKKIDARLMRGELRTRLMRMASSLSSLSEAGGPFAGKSLKLKVLSAWQDRSQWDDDAWVKSNWSAYGIPVKGPGDSDSDFQKKYKNWKDTFFSFQEGRGADLTILVNNIEPAADDATVLPTVFAWMQTLKLRDAPEARLFDFIRLQGTPKNATDPNSQAKYLFIHVSIKLPDAPLLTAKPVSLAAPSALEAVAGQYLANVVDYTDVDSLDSVINQFPGTPAGKAAFSLRYQLLHREGQGHLGEAAEC